MKRRTVSLVWGLFAALAGTLPACSDDATSDDDVKIDTSTQKARAQYDANLGFAQKYVARCGGPGSSGQPRVLVTGFGRWSSMTHNPSGKIVEALVPGLRYPESSAPAAGAVDPPAPQLSVARATITLPKVGKVDVCGMVLPVAWDLAATLILKEIARFQPSLVLMNGVAGSRQDLEFELGALNRASGTDNSSLAPAFGGDAAALVPTAPSSELGRPNLMSWLAVRDAATEAIQARGPIDVAGTPLSDIMPGAQLTRFPDPSNDYICNNVTYVVGYVMDHRGPIKLMEASKPVAGKANAISVSLPAGFQNVPRDFLHWPKSLGGAHVTAASEVLGAVIDAQLKASATGNAPTRGDNALVP